MQAAGVPWVGPVPTHGRGSPGHTQLCGRSWTRQVHLYARSRAKQVIFSILLHLKLGGGARRAAQGGRQQVSALGS